MAVYTETLSSELEFINRFDAELYRPDLKLSFDKLKNSNFSMESIKDHFLIRSGTTPIDRVDGLTEGPILFKTTDIRNKSLSHDGSYYHITDTIHKKMHQTQLKESDVLLNIVGATLSVIGRTAYVTDIGQHGANITQAMVLLRAKTSTFCTGFLFAFLNTKYGQDQIARYARPTGQYNLNLQEVGHITVPVINKKKQEEVQFKVISSFEKIKLSKTLYSQAQSLLEKELKLDQLVTDKLKSYETNLSDVICGGRNDAEFYKPHTVALLNKIEAYNGFKLSESFHVANGFPWLSTNFQEPSKGIPVIRIRNIRPGVIDTNLLSTLPKEYTQKCSANLAKKDDIVIGMDGIKYFYGGLIDNDCLVNQRVAHITPKKNPKVSSEYLTFIINEKLGQTQLLRCMTIANTVGHITNDNIRNILIPFPSQKTHDEITSLIKRSIVAKKQSEKLLEESKLIVEQLIEGVINEIK